MRRITDPRTRLERPRVAGDPRPAKPDFDAIQAHDHLDVLADMAVRHAVANGVDVHKTVGADASRQASGPDRQGPDWQGPQGLAFVTLETDDRMFVCGAVNALIGDGDGPLR